MEGKSEKEMKAFQEKLWRKEKYLSERMSSGAPGAAKSLQ